MPSKKKRNNKIKKRQAAEALKEQQQQLREGWAPIINGSSHPFLKKAFAYNKPQSLVFMVQHDSAQDDKANPMQPIPTHVQLDIADSEVWAKPCDPKIYPGPDQDPSIFLSLERITLTDQQFYSLHLMSTLELWEQDFWEGHMNMSYDIVHGRRETFLRAIAAGEMEDAWDAVETLSRMIIQHNVDDIDLSKRADCEKLWHVNMFTGEKTRPAEWYCDLRVTERVQWVLRDRRSDEGKQRQYEEDMKLKDAWLQNRESRGEGGESKNSSQRILSAIDDYTAKIKEDAAAAADLTDHTQTTDSVTASSPSLSDSLFPLSGSESAAQEQQIPALSLPQTPDLPSKARRRKRVPFKHRPEVPIEESRRLLREAMSDEVKRTSAFHKMATLVATPIVASPLSLVDAMSSGGKQGFCIAPADTFAENELGIECKKRNYYEQDDSSSAAAVSLKEATKEGAKEAEANAPNDATANTMQRLVQGKWTSADMFYFACLGMDEVEEFCKRAMDLYGPQFLEDSRLILQLNN